MIAPLLSLRPLDPRPGLHHGAADAVQGIAVSVGHLHRAKPTQPVLSGRRIKGKEPAMYQLYYAKARVQQVLVSLDGLIDQKAQGGDDVSMPFQFSSLVPK
jgi:hypothetical protein